MKIALSDWPCTVSFVYLELALEKKRQNSVRQRYEVSRILLLALGAYVSTSYSIFARKLGKPSLTVCCSDDGWSLNFSSSCRTKQLVYLSALAGGISSVALLVVFKARLRILNQST